VEPFELVELVADRPDENPFPAASYRASLSAHSPAGPTSTNLDPQLLTIPP
jgi:hypothetical protein